ncbi:DUF6194 family protein [Saccharopolyspora flava]|uniref:DUF6194 domain-containing protein n=1 Tax=Saccharopolyspora flava TaxID=95161 RepID=A0A1I6NRN3_9PSEU|nr:DUF6194 family protein [Saccharopolyspora flava]SFS30544.1 hypothetical protein SAMN05660874_00012 [Saccharopolyspora flava]
MSVQQILETVRAFDGVLELAPTEGGEFPEIAWGDHFFYYAPDGVVPQREQPYATIITKNYPGDDRCDLDKPDRQRWNIHVGRAMFTELTGEDPRSEAAERDLTATDVVFGHPLYRAQGWVSIINPGVRTHALAIRLLRQAHEDARQRRA